MGRLAGMYKLLVVDDEEYAVLGVSRGIDWQELKVDHIYEVFRASEAMRILQTEHVDVMISDIEMPGNSGIELLEWVNENLPSVKTIFLTGHASFQYAQKAVKLGSFDYLLKPVDYDVLKSTVGKALQEIVLENRQQELMDVYKKYYKLWTSQKPAFIERFWQDVLSERISSGAKQLDEAFSAFDIPLNPSDKVMIVLIKFVHLQEPMDKRDREIFNFAIRNIASEIILKNMAGAIIQDHNGNNLVMLYSMDGSENSMTLVKDACSEFIDACSQYIKCFLSCYIGDPVEATEIANSYKTLLKVDEINTTRSNAVIYQRDFRESLAETVQPAPFANWTVLLETGKKDELVQRVRKYMKETGNSGVSREITYAFYFGLMNMIYGVLHKNGVLIDEIRGLSNLEQASLPLYPLFHEDGWVIKVLSETADFLGNSKRNTSSLMDAIKAYVREHIQENFSREDMAAALYFNADYISRVFKKESGMILSDYILSQRIARAKELLADTNVKISDIAGEVGYTHFSHFTRLFKGHVGITPQEYRRKYAAWKVNDTST